MSSTSEKITVTILPSGLSRENRVSIHFSGNAAQIEKVREVFKDYPIQRTVPGIDIVSFSCVQPFVPEELRSRFGKLVSEGVMNKEGIEPILTEASEMISRRKGYTQVAAASSPTSTSR